MGFYDTFRRACAEQGLLTKGAPLRILRHATVLRAQNVMDYYATEISDESGFRKQLGRLVPPWPVMWLEVAAPTSRRLRITNHTLDWPPFAFAHAGVLVHTVEWPSATPGVPGSDGARWRLAFTSFFDIPIVEAPQGREWLRYPYVMGEVDLDADGYNQNDEVRVQRDMSLPAQIAEVLHWNQTILSDVLLLSLSFTNCRNVALPETRPATRPPTRKERKQHITPPAEHRFHTILIEPLKATFAKPAPGTPGAVEAGTPASASATPPAPHALHIVRGHFSTYTPERPLFGRPGLSGQFWIPTHLRGSAETGTLYADYEIRLRSTRTE